MTGLEYLERWPLFDVIAVMKWFLGLAMSFTETQSLAVACLPKATDSDMATRGGEIIPAHIALGGT